MRAARQQQASGPAPNAQAVAEAMQALSEEALAFVAPGRVQSLAQRWLAQIVDPPGPGDARDWFLNAMLLATDIMLCTPSSGGTTAFERVSRHRTNLTAAERAALTALCRSQHRVVRIERAGETGQCVVRDMVSLETIALPLDPLPPTATGATIMVRMAALGGGAHVMIGPVMPLNEAAVDIVRTFVRTGAKALVNPLRCAEAVYRQVVRHGTIRIAGLNAPPGEPAGTPDTDPIDAIAQAWSRLGEGPEPDDRSLDEIRGLAATGRLVHALSRAVTERAAGRSRLADGFTRVAGVMIETMVLRAAVGSPGSRLEATEAAIDDLVTRRGGPSAIRDLFRSLRSRAGTKTASGSADDAGFERLVQRVRALRAKTVARGCTEAEALAAAEKVAELLDRHGLTLSEIDLRRQRCEGIGIATSRRRRAPIDDCVPTIGAFFDCRVWSETAPSGMLHYVFFGLPGDVQAAEYLYEMVERAFDNETEVFRSGTFYQETHSSERRTATNSFQIGLARGICAKLSAMREARETVMRNGSGRELVPIKEAMVEAELAKLGMKFRVSNRPGPRSILTDAYNAGQEAGQRFDYCPGLTHADAA